MNVDFQPKSTDPERVVAWVRRMMAPEKELPRAFIVHGRDHAIVDELKEYLQGQLKFGEPIVLADQPSEGETVIEKFERYASEADIVFVLVTPDDVGYLSIEPEKARPRPRLNVIFELGFFLGLLQRRSGRVFLLYKGAVEKILLLQLLAIHGRVAGDRPEGVAEVVPDPSP